MKYLKTYESRYKETNIDKKYYVWKAPARYGLGITLAIIKINSILNGSIYYDAIRRTDGNYYDFFTNSVKTSYTYKGNKVSLSYWKRNMVTGLLFEADSLEDAEMFYELKLSGENVTRDNFDLYKNAKKYNI
jgi:hypothetical protein